MTLADLWQPYTLADVNGTTLPGICDMARGPAGKSAKPDADRQSRRAW